MATNRGRRVRRPRAGRRCSSGTGGRPAGTRRRRARAASRPPSPAGRRRTRYRQATRRPPASTATPRASSMPSPPSTVPCISSPPAPSRTRNASPHGHGPGHISSEWRTCDWNASRSGKVSAFDVAPATATPPAASFVTALATSRLKPPRYVDQHEARAVGRQLRREAVGHARARVPLVAVVALAVDRARASSGSRASRSSRRRPGGPRRRGSGRGRGRRPGRRTPLPTPSRERSALSRATKAACAAGLGRRAVACRASAGIRTSAHPRRRRSPAGRHGRSRRHPPARPGSRRRTSSSPATCRRW